MCCKIRSAECSGSGSLAISSRAFELPLHQKRVFLRTGVVILADRDFGQPDGSIKKIETYSIKMCNLLKV
jgi:hypothetical protein